MASATEKIAEATNLLGVSWTTLTIGCLCIAVITLAWLLIRREKTLRLIKFSVSPLGLKLTYELNNDEKLRTVVLENLELQSEVKALKASVRKERWQHFFTVMTFLLIR